MKKKIFLIFFCAPIIIFCQNPFMFDFKITDSVIIKKKHPYATKVNIEIDFIDFQDTMFLYLFNNCVRTIPWWNDSIVNYYSKDENFINPNDYVGLVYQLMNENNQVISGNFPYVFLSPRKEEKENSIGIFINSKQKFVKKRIKDENIHDYFLSKFEINNQKQKITLYPLLDEYHKNLPKGVYYLFFIYSFNPKPFEGAWFEEMRKDSRTFKGNIVSNKVKLIVE